MPSGRRRKVQIRNIEGALQLYKLDNGVYPSTEQVSEPWSRNLQLVSCRKNGSSVGTCPVFPKILGGIHTSI